MRLESMYQEIILDHYRHPHGAGLRSPYDVEVHHVNPTCGDEVRLRVLLDGTGTGAVVKDVSYSAVGCSISQASTSVMHDLVVDRPVSEGLERQAEFLRLMQSRGEVDVDDDLLEDAVAFTGVSKYPARVKCALLGWMAFKDATAQAVAGTEGDR
jgi:nitrogen fixation protein NifU and related proteins